MRSCINLVVLALAAFTVSPAWSAPIITIIRRETPDAAPVHGPKLVTDPDTGKSIENVAPVPPFLNRKLKQAGSVSPDENPSSPPPRSHGYTYKLTGGAAHHSSAAPSTQNSMSKSRKGLRVWSWLKSVWKGKGTRTKRALGDHDLD